MTLGGWLRSLGLERYEAVFSENEIDLDLLSELTEGDLEKLGLAMGPRKRLLKAIADLSDTTVTGPAAPIPLSGSQTAERRQVTVMFSDLVGSTALSARMDPEDLRELISAYQKCVAETVQRFGGFPDGGIVLLTFLDGQQATVLQLQAEPKTAVDSMLQKRVAYTG